MAERATGEGWGVSARSAAWLVLSFFGALGLFIAGVGLFYRLSTGRPDAARPITDPAPQLQTAQRRPDDHLPGDLTGPPRPTPAQARAIRGAMATLAARKERGWAPPGEGGAS